MLHVTPKDLQRHMEQFLRYTPAVANDRIPACLILGPAGVGKTSIVRQKARELGWTVREVLLANTLDPAELKGLPVQDQEKKVTQWLVSEELQPPADGEKVVYLLDEITRIGHSIFGLLASLVTSCSVVPGHYIPPQQARIIATGNPWDSSDYVTTSLDHALQTRFKILWLERDLGDWLGFMLERASGIEDEEVRQRLMDWAAIISSADELWQSKAATPRSWTQALDEAAQFPAMAVEIVDSYIAGAGREFMALTKTAAPIPGSREILQDPENAARVIIQVFGQEDGLRLGGWGVRRYFLALAEYYQSRLQSQPHLQEPFLRGLVRFIVSQHVPDEVLALALSLISGTDATRDVLRIQVDGKPAAQLINQALQKHRKRLAEVLSWSPEE